MTASDPADAYRTLSCIQGFDSFKLTRRSSADEIQRAFAAQRLIWHPDKNPGDAVARETYATMQRAHAILMDPEQRRLHDEQLAAIPLSVPSAAAAAPSAEASKAAARQLPPDWLGPAPRSARPFAYVDSTPQPSTPAALAGVRRGDALVRIGEAAHLRDVQGVLEGQRLLPVPALVIEASGGFVKKWIVPHSWDPDTPGSLLG